jgi:uroporphyrinogen III methyltransferase/synthase
MSSNPEIPLSASKDPAVPLRASRFPRPAMVSLVGAGPGDPQLITVGGAARITAADCILYDRLANPALLSQARADAELIYAGKLPDRHMLTQDEINALLVEKGRAGLRVVRLKGGDPFVFGRGGEEAEALIAAGVPFEVLPGVTSATAAPAYAGIPVTHRALASSFAVITGHEDPAKDASSVDWAHLATGVDTLIFLMGAARLDEIARQLMEHGRGGDTPVAVIEWGTLPRQRTVSGTLETIAAAVREAKVEPPAVTVVGEVAALRDGLRWFDTRPLFGKRVLVTRTREQASELSRLLASQGAEPIELATIEIVPAYDDHDLADAIDGLRTSAYGSVVFTSANAVPLFARHLRDAGLDARAFGRAQIAAIGPGTADALAVEGLRADIIPERYVAESLLEAFGSRVMRGQRVLLPRAHAAREVLVDGLVAMGARVHELKLYRAEVPQRRDANALRSLRAGEVDIITFASSSSVRNLIAMLDGDLGPLKGSTIAAIGPVTAQAVRDARLEVAITADRYTIEGLVAALVTQALGDRAKPAVPSTTEPEYDDRRGTHAS